MKSRIIIYMAMAMVFLWNFSLKAENERKQKCQCKNVYTTLPESVYLETENINFADNQIFVSIEGITYMTPAIHADEKGYYVQKVKRYGCSWYEWECKRCHWCNWKVGDLKCQSCDCPKADCS